MARSYSDVSAERRVRLSPEAREQRKVFEQAYDVALQVIELRERHGQDLIGRLVRALAAACAAHPTADGLAGTIRWLRPTG